MAYFGDNYAKDELDLIVKSEISYVGEKTAVVAEVAAAPRDPNNTGATGTITGLSGGSLSGPQIQGVFWSNCVDFGIELGNPYDTAPVADPVLLWGGRSKTWRN